MELYVIELILEILRLILQSIISVGAGSVEDIENQKYLHSSKCIELEQAIENPNNIITCNIIAFGSANEMATLEHTELAKVHAVSNSDYFNRSNGGGRYVLNLNKQQEMIDNIMNNILLNKYPINFYNKSELDMLGFYQVRLQLLDRNHVNNLKDRMKIISKALPDTETGERPKIDPIVILMSKDKDGKSKIIGGNHSRAACLGGIPLMNGLEAIEVPYKDWCDLAECDIVTLGLLLNPMEEKVRLSNNLDDIANWIVNCIEDHKLYKNVLPINGDVKDPWWSHDYIKHFLNNMNILPNQKGPTIQKAMRIFEERTGIKPGNNYIDWSDAGLESVPYIKKWLNDHTEHMRKHKNTTVIKITSDLGIMTQIDKRLIKTDIRTGNIIKVCPNNKVLVFYFFPLSKDRNSLKGNWERQYNAWNEHWYKDAIDQKYDIKFELLPETTAELPSDYQSEDLED